MNPLLENKYNELKESQNYECWYLVKQPTEFDNICYLVSFLEEYKTENKGLNLQEFISGKITLLSRSKPEVKISNNYRALRVAAYFGLIIMTSTKYEEAIITDSFIQIKERCEGQFEQVYKYLDIIERQIEKMYISSEVDEQSKTVRQKFRLYPVMLLYKVLIEIGRTTGLYRIEIDEYRYFIATTKLFEDFLETLIYIKLFRDAEKDINFDEFRGKFDNRLIQALKQLPTLNITREYIEIKSDKVKEVAKKVFLFEENPSLFETNLYLEFLGSEKSLFDLEKERIDEDNQKFNSSNESIVNRITTGTNILIYGVPGSGKSWTIKHEYCTPESHLERLVFHPDYTYSDFVGQILPNVAEDGQISYKFTPGPFTTILRDAYEHPEEDYVLIIEEINRGNAPAIFGEVFQLLDRKVEASEYDDGLPIGTSEYGITNPNIANIVYGDPNKKVRIPSNLSIIGTMNTSDQNVFTLDTAFQRRWEMRLIENNFDTVDLKLADARILDTTVTWRNFCTTINDLVIGNSMRMASSEDKRLGAYFVHASDLRFDERMGNLGDGAYDDLRNKESNGSITSDEYNTLHKIRRAMQHNRKFPEKVIKYLWDDAFKLNRESVFEVTQYHGLETIIKAFLWNTGNDRFMIFKENIRNAFTENRQ